MLAGLLYGLVALLARLGAWPRRLPRLPWACGLALSGALAYGWLAGFDVPVRRACLMVTVVLVWRLRFRHLGVWLPLLLALDGVLLFDPWSHCSRGSGCRLERWRFWHWRSRGGSAHGAGGWP